MMILPRRISSARVAGGIVSRCDTQAVCTMHTKVINTIPAIRIGYLLICKLNPLSLNQFSCASLARRAFSADVSLLHRS